LCEFIVTQSDQYSVEVFRYLSARATLYLPVKFPCAEVVFGFPSHPDFRLRKKVMVKCNIYTIGDLKNLVLWVSKVVQHLHLRTTRSMVAWV
ncbi:hypothetical protein TorRG33x02_318610, partial [Trema orientale]